MTVSSGTRVCEDNHLNRLLPVRLFESGHVKKTSGRGNLLNLGGLWLDAKDVVELGILDFLRHGECRFDASLSR